MSAHRQERSIWGRKQVRLSGRSDAHGHRRVRARQTLSPVERSSAKSGNAGAPTGGEDTDPTSMHERSRDRPHGRAVQ